MGVVAGTLERCAHGMGWGIRGSERMTHTPAQLATLLVNLSEKEFENLKLMAGIIRKQDLEIERLRALVGTRGDTGQTVSGFQVDSLRPMNGENGPG